MVKQIHLRAKGWNEISRILSSFDRRFAADVAAVTGGTHNPTYTYYHTQRTTKIIFIYFLGWNIFSEKIENSNSYASSDRTSCHGIWRLSMMEKYVRNSEQFSLIFCLFLFLSFLKWTFCSEIFTLHSSSMCFALSHFSSQFLLVDSLEDIYSSMK